MTQPPVNRGRKLMVRGALVTLIALLAALFLCRWLLQQTAPVAAPAPPPAERSSAAAPTNSVPVDLSTVINAQLDLQWNTTTYPGDDLAELPRGWHEFDGVTFDVRGVVQLQGRVWQKRGCPFPEKVEGIPVHRVCRFLYLLHADGGAHAPTGVAVALLVLHYNDGTLAEIPIQHDIHVKDWWSYGRPPPTDPNTVVAWVGQNKATARMGRSVRLYKTRFDNPYPAKPIETLDYVSAMEDPGPFLVALTVQ
jgi:hypothetical protein